MLRWLTQGTQDLRLAGRVLVRTPGATLAAVLTLALTIGATTAVFSGVRAVLLRPLPYPDPGRLVRVWEVRPRGSDHNVASSASFLAWTERARSFAALAAFQSGFDVALTGDGPPEKLDAAAITPSTLTVLGVAPALGAGLPPGLMEAGQPPEVLLSAAFWQRRFGGDPEVVGRDVTLDGTAYRVAGVMPRGFSFPSDGVDVWFAERFAAADREEWRSHNYGVLGRLAPGVDLRRAQAEMTALARNLVAEHPTDLAGWGVNVVPAHADAVRGVRPLLLVLLGVVVVVLVIACANLATLQLARASRRGLEMAVRAAIGAGRGRLVRQLLAESLLVAALGGGLGGLLLASSLRAIVAAAPPDIPFLDAVRLDPALLGFAAAVTVVCAALVGLAPALETSRPRLGPLLSAGHTPADRGRTRLRQLLVAGQIGLAVVLLVAAMLLARSFWKLQAVDHGFDPDRLLTVAIDLPRVRYPDNAAQVRFYRALLERLRALPGVTAAAGTTQSPGRGAGMTYSFAIEGRTAPNPNGREDPVPLQGVTPGYFATLGVPVLAGRPILAADGPGSPGVVVVNRALAARHWPAGGAVGARIRFREDQPWYRIAGVVGDTHDEGLEVPAPPTIYLPLAQRQPSWAWMSWQTLVVRTAGDPAAMLPAVRAALWDLDPDLPLLQTTTMRAAFAENDARRRFATGLIGAFAALALGLGAVGVFGVLSCAMAERRREIGIRIALGAEPGRVAGSLVRGTMGYVLTGAAIGLAVAAAATRFLRSLLFAVEPTDPVTFAAVAVLLLAVAALAAWLPARRASRLDPLAVLRDG